MAMRIITKHKPARKPLKRSETSEKYDYIHNIILNQLKILATI